MPYLIFGYTPFRLKNYVHLIFSFSLRTPSSSHTCSMREQGNVLLFNSTEKKQVSVKIDTDKQPEGRRRVFNGKLGTINGGGRAVITNNQLNSMVVTAGQIKGANIMQGRHLMQSLVFDNSAAGEAAFGEGSPLGKKRTAEEERTLPQWGHGKRSRGNRFEPSMQAVSVVGLASKSTARSEKAAPLSAPKLRGPSKLTSNKPSLPLRQNGGEAKERTSRKESASSVSRQKSAFTDHGTCREFQEDSGSELASTVQGHLKSNVDINMVTNNGDAVHDGQSLIHANSANCMSLCDPSSLACVLKFRGNFQSLEWPRIVITLTRKEKEDDFLAFRGSKLPQRPKRRPKAVERALHYCTPGNWLIDLARGRYDVREKKRARKKPKGLKAMESLESDTD